MQNSEEAKLRRQQLLQERDKTSFRRYFTSVGFTILASFCAVPFVRNKVMMQCRPEHIIAGREPLYTKPLAAFRHIWKNEGKTKIFRGIMPYMSFIIPVAFIRQSTTNSFSQDLDERPSAIAGFSRGFAAATITSLLSTLFIPFTVSATKMMGDMKPAKRAIFEYQGPISTLRSIYAFGGPTKLFTGAIPNWAHNVTHFTTLWSLTMFFSAPALGLNPAFATLISSILAVLVTHPIDTIKTRMQFRLHTQVTDYIPEYKGMLACARDIWTNEGIRGFYRGGSGALGMYGIALFWTMYASSRGHKLRGKEAKNEALVQRRAAQTNDLRTKFQRERELEDRFYGFERQRD